MKLSLPSFSSFFSLLCTYQVWQYLTMTGNRHTSRPASPHQSDSHIDNQQCWLKAIKHWAETPTLQHRAEKKQDSWLKYVTRRLMLDSDIKNVHIRPQPTTIWGHVDKKTPPVHFCSPHNSRGLPKVSKISKRA